MKKSKIFIVILLCVFSLSLVVSCSLNTTKVQEEVQKNVENVIISDVPSNKIETKRTEVVNADILSKIQVYFIDVGQSDSTLIVTPNKEAILIDTGVKESTNAILEQINETGIRDLDLVISTHSNLDHIGGMQGIIGEYNVGEIVISNESSLRNFENLLENTENNNITQAKKGMKRSIDGVNIEVLAVDITSDESSSILLKVEYGDISLLFTGDISGKSEKLIIDEVNKDDLSADILKVGNHGNENSTSDMFLYKVNPKVAVISVGKDNKSNLPSVSTIDKLMKKGISFYRTDEEGTIEFEIDGVDIVTILSENIEEIRPKMYQNVNIAEVAIIEQVYTVEDSNQYHRSGCSMLKGSTKTISMDDAELKGLIECEICFK